MGPNGRIYHPGPQRLHGVGLISSKLAIEFSQGFKFDTSDIPSHFQHEHVIHKLDHEIGDILKNIGKEIL